MIMDSGLFFGKKKRAKKNFPHVCLESKEFSTNPVSCYSVSMKLTILPDHFKYFQRYGSIEFTGFINSQQIEQINSEIDLIEKKRQASTKEEKNPWLLGRDLWRENDSLRKILCQAKWAEIAAQLTNAKVIRFGFDQLLEKPDCILTSGSLEEASHLQGIACSLLLGLKGNADSPFPKQGDACYYNSDFPFDFSQLPDKSRYLLIVYAQERTLYTKKSPEMNRMEYRVGEILKDKFHPILYRV
jgi:hypothetical protein